MGGWSKAVWNFSENSSDLAQPPFPQSISQLVSYSVNDKGSQGSVSGGIKMLYCSSQRSMVHWLRCPIFPCSLFVRPAMVTCFPSSSPPPSPSLDASVTLVTLGTPVNPFTPVTSVTPLNLVIVQRGGGGGPKIF